MVEARKRFHFETQPEARSGPNGNLERIVQIPSSKPGGVSYDRGGIV
jgi:hypothetical protein